MLPKDRPRPETPPDDVNRLTRAEFEALGQIPDPPKPLKGPSISLEDFLAKAVALDITVQDMVILKANPKQFSTGSYGWHVGTRVTVKVDGKPVEVIANLGFTVVNSKPKGK